MNNHQKKMPMDIDVTHNSLVRHLYGENMNNSHQQVSQMIEANWQLQEEFCELEKAQNALNQVGSLRPSASSIRLIMEYNSRTKATETLYE
ncbi:MAG: hypothetical protein JNM36_11705 [Chitinophagales bacterium]|nr:hypothetical protein [Chitinophagales bacterium]